MRSTPFLLVALVSVASLSTAACGASINAVYEGDVRFERCMALDSRLDAKPTLRRACWQEWLQFYTFGQTRDRVEYATRRDKQLSKASDFDEGAWSPLSGRAPSAVPEPTSALAPPPMLLIADAGVAAAADGEADAGAAPPTPAVESDKPRAAGCTGECQDGWNTCRRDCKSPACDNACATRHQRCIRRCP